MKPEPVAAKSLSHLVHGFFTRRGGVSSGVYSSLNCGIRTDDSEVNVHRNRSIVAESMGVSPKSLVTAYQRHTTDIVSLRGRIPSSAVIADGLVTDISGIAIGVLTADCQPILLSDPENRVIGVVHAGWRGTLGGIIQNGVQAMENLGANRESIIAVVGPSISKRNYEVGKDVADKFGQVLPSSTVFLSSNRNSRFQLDLPGLGALLLRESGVDQVETIGLCTYDEEELLFSYRRSCHRGEAACGLMISAIVM